MAGTEGIGRRSDGHLLSKDNLPLIYGSLELHDAQRVHRVTRVTRNMTAEKQTLDFESLGMLTDLQNSICMSICEGLLYCYTNILVLSYQETTPYRRAIAQLHHRFWLSQEAWHFQFTSSNENQQCCGQRNAWALLPTRDRSLSNRSPYRSLEHRIVRNCLLLKHANITKCRLVQLRATEGRQRWASSTFLRISLTRIILWAS